MKLAGVNTQTFPVHAAFGSRSETRTTSSSSILGEHALHYLLVIEVPSDDNAAFHTGIAREGSVNVALGLCRRAEMALEREVEIEEEEEAT